MRLPGRGDLPLILAVVVALAAGAFFLVRDTDEDDRFADYCAEVEERREEIGEAVALPRVGLIRALPSFRALADKAPDDIRDEWAIVITRVEELEAAFEAADTDPATYDRKRPPADVSPAERDAIEAAAVRLGSRESRDALAAVDQQARDVCKTPLSL